MKIYECLILGIVLAFILFYLGVYGFVILGGAALGLLFYIAVALSKILKKQ